MPRKIRRFLLGLLAMLIAGVLVLLIVINSQSPPRTVLPNPNGYDDLLQAGSNILGDIYVIPTLDNLQALIVTNTETLRLLRLGLSRTCSIPTELAVTNFLAPGSSDLPHLKMLAHLLVAEGRLAEPENRPTDAARSYLDCIRLGNESSRGGFVSYSRRCHAGRTLDIEHRTLNFEQKQS